MQVPCRFPCCRSPFGKKVSLLPKMFKICGIFFDTSLEQTKLKPDRREVCRAGFPVVGSPFGKKVSLLPKMFKICGIFFDTSLEQTKLKPDRREVKVSGVRAGEDKDASEHIYILVAQFLSPKLPLTLRFPAKGTTHLPRLETA